MKIKTGDEVLVLHGADKGKKGKIEKVFTKKGQVLVAGVNLRKKHRKRSGNIPAGISTITKPLPAANVVLICPKCNLPTRVSFVLREGTKERICKKCKSAI